MEGGSTVTTPTKTVTPPTQGGSTSTTVSANMIVATKPSGWSDLYIYAYQSGATATKLTGEWPGTKMSAGSDGKYTYTMDSSVTSAKIIFASGASGSQDPQDVPGQECGFDYVGGKAYSYDGGKWSEVSISSTVTETPSKTDPPATKTPTPTPTAKVTKAPTPTPTAKVTEVPVEGPQVSTSLENGAVFKTETQDVKLTFKNATEVTYSVDGGPKKTVDATKNQSVTVTLGQGKIANREVTLEVESTNGSKTNKQTFTYTKEFVKSAGTVKALSTFAASVLEKITEEAETVNGAPGSSYYATNPNGNVGARKTITSASDFTEDMIIAQGVANDDPGTFRGTHEAPKFDPYAMYGAWDDENLYIGIQYTNVTDVVDPAQQAPQTGRGKPNGADADIPQMLVFDTRTGDYTDGITNDTVQKTAWDVNVKYDGDTKVDKIFLYSPKDGIINQALFPVSNGIVDYDNVVKSGYNMPAIPGVETIWEDGFFGSSMYGIKGTGYTGYEPDDLNSDSGDWVDFLSEGHSTEHDTFCIVKLPLSLLGVTASDIESNGIGVMAIATYGSSGIGSLPMDMTMLDVATEAYSKDDSTSQEKEDEDIVTVPLAQLGKSSGVVTTKNPVVTDTPTKVPTEAPSKTETPASAAPDKTTEPSKTAAPTQTVATDEKIYCVNFGADKSSPQLNTTSLTLKAEVFDGTEPYTYEFLVDGAVVQQASSTDSYVWKNAAAGEHTIKVVVKDKAGNETSSEKTYVIEEEKGIDIPTQNPTETPKATGTVKPTETPVNPTATATSTVKPTETPANPTAAVPVTVPPAPATEQPGNDPSVEDIEVTLTTNKKSSQVKGTKIIISASVKGGSGNYKYSFMVENSSGTITSLASNSTKSSVTWTPAKKGTYKLSVIVEDVENDTIGSDIQSYKITAKAVLTYNSFKANKKTVKVKKKITLTASGTAGQGKVKYRFYYKKKGTKKKIVLHKYSTTKKIKWTVPSKKGTYYVYCKIKDGSGKTLLKRVTIKVTKK